MFFRQDLLDLMDFFVSAFPPARHRKPGRHCEASPETDGPLRRGGRGRKAENTILLILLILSGWALGDRDRNAARATLGEGLAVSAFPLYVPV